MDLVGQHLQPVIYIGHWMHFLEDDFNSRLFQQLLLAALVCCCYTLFGILMDKSYFYQFPSIYCFVYILFDLVFCFNICLCHQIILILIIIFPTRNLGCYMTQISSSCGGLVAFGHMPGAIWTPLIMNCFFQVFFWVGG